MSRSLVTKLIVGALTMALIVTTPGLGCWQALAQLRVTGGAPIEVPALPVRTGSLPIVAPTLPGAPTTAPTGFLSLPRNIATTAAKRLSAQGPATVPLTQPAARKAVGAEGLAAAEENSNGIRTRGPSPLAQARWAGAELRAERTDASLTLNAAFENQPGASKGGTDGVLGMLRQGRLADLLRAGAPAAEEPESVPTPKPSGDGPAAGPPQAPESKRSAAPTRGSAAPTRGSAGVILLLGAAGGVAAYLGAPLIVALAAPHLPSIATAWLAAHPAAAAAALGAVGALGGIASTQTDLWKAFPRGVWETSVSAAATTFRVWAMAGIRFDAALRGKPSEDGAKIETPANILKYPPIAWPFVALGYGFTPVAFGVGFLYKAVGTPINAAWRGVKRLALGLFPWLLDVYEKVVRALRKAIPFVGGFLWGGIKAAGVSIAVGAVTLARPVFENLINAPYGGSRVSGLVAYRVAQAGGVAVIVGLGAAGAVLGLALSPLYVLTYALYLGLKWAGAKNTLAAVTDAWRRALEREEGFTLISAAEAGKAGQAREGLDFGTGLIRLVNAATAAPHAAVTLVALSLTAYFRAWTGASEEKLREVSTLAPRAKPAPSEDEPKAKPRFLKPFFYGLAGAFIGMQLYNWFLLIPLGLTGWAGVAAYAVSGLLGAGTGFALTQKSPFAGYGRAVRRAAVETAGGNFRFWARTGLNADASLRNAGPEAELYREAPAMMRRYPWLARPAVAAGYLSWAGGLVAGGLWEAVAIPAGAAWDGLAEMVQSFWPFIRRVAKVLWRVAKRILPFGFGFVFGTIGGALGSAVTGAKVFTLPFSAIAKSIDYGDTEISRPEFVATIPVLIVGFAAFLAAGALGLAAGLVWGVPAALIAGMSLALKWAKVGGRTQRAAELWWRHSGPAEAKGLSRLTSDSFQTRKLRFGRAATQVGNVLLSTPVLALTSSVAALVASVRSVRSAWRLAGGEEEPAQTERLDREEVEKDPPPAEVPSSGTPVAATFLLGLAGLAAGLWAPLWLGLPALGPLATAGIYATTGLIGATTGLALSQPRAWLGVVGRVKANAKDSAAVSWDHWDRLGTGFDQALRGVDGPVKRRAGWLHAVLGSVAAGVFGLLGGVYGAALSPALAAGRGLAQIADELWPWLKRAWDFVYRLARRLVPFVAGWVAGAVTGLVGAALFGALVISRPYYQYVILRDFEKGGLLNSVGRAALKAAAFVVATVLGLVGLGAGVLIAAPYAVTLMPSMAFQLADVDGSVTRFFDLWSKVRLREEMRRMDAFTGRMEFPEQEGKPLALADGWIRLLNIGIFSLVVPFATLIVGVVGYFRSVVNAIGDVRAGKEAPPSAGYEDLGVAWRSARTGARQGSRWTARLAAWGGGIAGLIVGWKTGLLTGLWKAALWGVGGLFGGWVAGLVTGAIVGLGVGLIIWLGRQLSAK